MSFCFNAGRGRALCFSWRRGLIRRNGRLGYVCHVCFRLRECYAPKPARAKALSTESLTAFLSTLGRLNGLGFVIELSFPTSTTPACLYLLRNADNRAKGLGFALAGNFYPDFLLWLVDDKSGKQWLSFIDPKGIRNMRITDPKFGLYKEVKEIERQLGDTTISLSAFILSITAFKELLDTAATNLKADLEERNVLFLDDGWQTYMPALLKRMLAA